MSDPLDPGPREQALALLPRALVALGIGCSISGIGGFLAIVGGAGAPPVPVLLVPPAAALGAAAWWGRRPRLVHDEEER